MSQLCLESSTEDLDNIIATTNNEKYQQVVNVATSSSSQTPPSSPTLSHDTSLSNNNIKKQTTSDPHTTTTHVSSSLLHTAIKTERPMIESSSATQHRTTNNAKTSHKQTFESVVDPVVENVSNSQMMGLMQTAFSNSAVHKSVLQNEKINNFERKKSRKNILKKRLSGVQLELELFQTVLSVLSAAEYIAASYIQIDIDSHLLALSVLDLIFIAFFILFFLINFLLSKEKLTYFINPLSILDYVTVIPSFVLIILAFQHSEWLQGNTYAIVGLLRVLRLLRVIPLVKKISRKGDINSVAAKVIELALTIVCLLILFSGIFQWCEAFFSDKDIYFHDCLYFIVITLFTIGYGDISPSNPVSRYAVILFFLVGVSLIPLQLSGIYDIITSEDNIFKVKNLLLKKHVIVSGSARHDEVLDFIKHFFHKFNKKKTKKLICVFKSKELSDQLRESLKKNPYRSFIYIYSGDIMDFDIMQLLEIPTAHSVFLLNSPKIGHPRKQDNTIIMTTIALRNFNKNLKVFAQINLVESKPYLIKAGAKVIVCNESISSKILSASAVSSGIGTFLFNIMSAVEITNVSKNFYDSLYVENKWILEYSEGLNCQIYRVDFSPAFYNSLFIDAAFLLITKSEVNVFAVEDVHGNILVNPSNYLIKEGDRCFCIAKSLKQAKDVSNYQSTEDEELKTSKKLKTAKPFIYNSQKIIEELGDEYYDPNYADYLAKEQMDFEGIHKNENKEVMKISEKHKKKVVEKKTLPSKLMASNATRTRRKSISSESRKADIYLLRDKHDEPSEEELSTLHMEILLKLISPEFYFLQKRLLLKTIKQKKPEERKHFEDEFYSEVQKTYNLVNNTPRSKEEFLITNYRVPALIRDHILIIGEFQQPTIICSIIRSLSRQNYFTPIVFMSPFVDKYFVFLYERLKFFSNVYFISGNPSKSFDLRKAGAHLSKSILYITQEEKLVNIENNITEEAGDQEQNDYNIDSEAIKLALSIDFIDSNKFFMIELCNRSNLKFIQHDGVSTYEKITTLQDRGIIEHNLDEFDRFCLFSDLYISGKIFPSSSFLSRILAQSLTNKRITELLDQLLADEFVAGENQSVLFEVPVHAIYVGLTVFDMISNFYEHGLILMALSRMNKSKEEYHRYTYTNPSLSTILHSTDVLVICGKRCRYQSLLKNYNREKPTTNSHHSSQVILEEEVVIKLNDERDVFTDPQIVISPNSPNSETSSPPTIHNASTFNRPSNSATTLLQLPSQPLRKDVIEDEEDKAPRMSFDQLLLRSKKH